MTRFNLFRFPAIFVTKYVNKEVYGFNLTEANFVTSIIVKEKGLA